jgi:hypothetical protein
MKIINCKVCGTEFESKGGANKICSDKCRDTQKERAREKWRTQSPDHKKQWSHYTRAWSERNPFRAKVTSVRARAKALGLAFDLDEKWFEDNTPEYCPVLGIKLDQGDRVSTSSVDKVIPRLGYTKENCRIISLKANMLKNDASVEDLEKIIAYMKNSS